MKRVALAVALVVAVGFGVDLLGDLTQDRPDRSPAGSRSEILLQVNNRNVHGSAREGAEGLWAACQGTVHHRLAEPGVVDVGGGRFLLVTTPAVGKHGWRRLQGCLEDQSVDKVRGHVVTKRDILPS